MDGVSPEIRKGVLGFRGQVEACGQAAGGMRVQASRRTAVSVSGRLVRVGRPAWAGLLHRREPALREQDWSKVS